MVVAQQQAKFLSGNLFGHITVMSLTASLGLMAVFLVDFVDMVFISLLGKAELAAAVGYAGAILFFTSSFGIGMSIAAGALVARSLGAGDGDEARMRATTALVYGFGFGAVFAAVVWANLHALTGLVGASGETQALAVGYLRIVIPSLPLLLIGMVGSAILRAHGAARRAMWVTITGGIVNAVLDPVLIFGLDLDLTGAALASVASRVAIAVAAILPILRHHGGFARPGTADFVNNFSPIFAVAAPAILTQLATPVGQAYVTRAMAEFGEDAVAGLAIISRLTPVAFGTIFALSGAVGPIIGQNYGAGNFARVRRAYLDALLFTALVVVAVALVLYGLRGPIGALFMVEGISREVLYLFCGPLALVWFFNGVVFVSNAAFNNLGHPLQSTWINWGRHTAGTIPFVILFAGWFGAAGVLIGQAVGGVLFGLLSAWLAMRVIARKEAPRERVPFQRQARLMQLFFNRR